MSVSEGLRDQALAVFRGVQTEFPSLRMAINPDDPNVDASVAIPKQAGLDFDVDLNLQNRDELHLQVESFWCSWFPCSDPEVVARYRAAVVGLLAGRFRILEFRRWGKVVRAELQAPVESGWKTLASSGSGLLPTTWGTTTAELRNRGAA